MSKQTGTAGEAEFNSNTLHITYFETDISDDIMDSTDSGSSGWRENLAKGLKKLTCLARGHFDDGDTVPAAGDSATLALTYDSGDTLSGTALVERIRRTVNVADPTLNQYEINFIGSGAFS